MEAFSKKCYLYIWKSQKKFPYLSLQPNYLSWRNLKPTFMRLKLNDIHWLIEILMQHVSKPQLVNGQQRLLYTDESPVKSNLFYTIDSTSGSRFHLQSKWFRFNRNLVCRDFGKAMLDSFGCLSYELVVKS